MLRWLWRLACLMVLGLVFLTPRLAAQQPGGPPSFRPPQFQPPVMDLDLARTYAFLAGGHLYGSHESQSPCPSSTLLSAQQLFQPYLHRYFFALGDNVRDGNDPAQLQCMNALRGAFSLRMVFLIGNHDLDSSNTPPSAFGPTNMFFNYHHEAFLTLNTELLRIGRCGELLGWLRGTLPAQDTSKTVFVFSHRLLWALFEPDFREMDDFANEPFGPAIPLDSARMVYEEITRWVGKRPMHWFSGDVGARWSGPAFYGCTADSSRHFYAAGLGDTYEDALWEVIVEPNGKVETRLRPVLMGEWPEKDSLGLPQWRRRMAEQALRDRPSLWQRIQAGWAWIFLAGGLSVLLGVWWWRRKRRAA